MAEMARLITGDKEKERQVHKELIRLGVVWYGLGRLWARRRRGRAISTRDGHDSSRNSAKNSALEKYFTPMHL